MNDLDELTRYLHTRADATDLGHTPLGVITRAGTRRRNRHRALTTAGVLAAGAVGTVVSVQVLGTGDTPGKVSTDPVATQPPPPDTAAPPEPESSVAPRTDGADGGTVQSPLVWNSIDVDASETLNTLTWISDTTSNSELPPYYRLATAPGRARVEHPGYYRSPDGVHWEYLGDDDSDRPAAVYSGRSIGVVDGRRYVIEHQVVDAGSPIGPMMMSVSDDGVAWRDVPLPYDLAGLAAERGVASINLAPGGVAGHGDTVVVGALAHTGLTERSVAELIGEPGSVGYDETGEGFIQYATTPVDCTEYHRLFDAWLQTTQELESSDPSATFPRRPGIEVKPGECYRWDTEIRRVHPQDLGLSPEAAAAGLGTPLLFASTRGSDFVRVDAPRPPVGERVSRFAIVADGDGFVGIISTYQSIRAYRTDASFTAWREIGSTARSDGGIALLGAVGAVGGNVVAVYESSAGASISTLHGDEWVTHNPADLLPGNGFELWSQGALGANGVGLIGGVYPPADGVSPVLLYSPDGLAWSAIDLGTITDMRNRLVTGLMFTGDRVLVTVREMTDLENPDTPLPNATVLVGTLA